MSQKTPQPLVFFRLLAVAHGIVGFIPVLFTVFVGGLLAGGAWWTPVGGIRVGWLLVVAVQLLLPLAWAAWLLVLASRLWNPTFQLAGQLCWTHLIGLVVGGLHCAAGLYGMWAAGRSAAAGGGLLSPAAALPLLIGVPFVALALISLLAARRIGCHTPGRRRLSV